MTVNLAHTVPSPERISLLPQVIDCFSQTQSMDELCREIVLNTTKTLGFDRCGCFLFDAVHHQKIGMWGIDNFGQLADERGMVAPIHEHEVSPPPGAGAVVVFTDHVLYHQEQFLGKGTLIQCSIFDGNALLGWLFIDNFLTKHEFGRCDIAFIELYGAIVGQLMVRQQHQEQLKSQNQQLIETIQKLQSAQQEISETKNILALSRLVCGVAHELNTPLGVTLTAASHVKTTAAQLVQQIDIGTMSKSQLRHQLLEIKEGSELACNSIARSVQLIGDFKQLMSANDYEVAQPVALANIVTECFARFKDEHPHLRLNLVLNRTAPRTTWSLPLNIIIKIVDELMSNAIVHGFEGRSQGQIQVELNEKHHQEKPHLYICFSDDGVGMTDNLALVFDPFFTRNQQIGTGLGLSIVHNLVKHSLAGHINVSSSELGGLAFEMWLPLDNLAD